jgi:hypothetical protein
MEEEFVGLLDAGSDVSRYLDLDIGRSFGETSALA